MTEMNSIHSIPRELSAYLEEIGVKQLKSEIQQVTELEKYVAWIPSYEGEEPPF